MVNTDVLGFFSWDCASCGQAAKDIPMNAWVALKFFGKFGWLTQCKQVGQTRFQQDPDCVCWYNVPLCCAMCWLAPCCCPAVYLHNMEKMSGKSCESECLTFCLFTFCGCCCVNMCYYGARRTAMREKYGLRGSECVDCCCFGCSPLCMTCVDANELQHHGGYEIPFCGAKAATTIRKVTHADVLSNKVAELNDKMTDKIVSTVAPSRV